ncbi:hypothetical protein TrRE_jg8989 [Triparma retinervis]|uniref:Uncharacterized protein n=1 Tax=Triparma retinervis TaxID=2557542 RepID=A0A9W7A3H5_9STRA|nr:hypothetical protein TrRE_jg8989 [Triparma retinervis]
MRPVIVTGFLILAHLWLSYAWDGKHGNRNAASHLWSTFIINNAADMKPSQVELFFSGFCAVSGSPVRPNDYNRYLLTLPLVSGEGERTGAMHYCCWPCVCDSQDFIRVDTLTIPTNHGPRQYHFAVVGNPCENEEALHKPFHQPFYGGRDTTLAREAREVRCINGELAGATMSDHGFVIISMFFDLPIDGSLTVTNPATDFQMQPGRVSDYNGVQVQHEREYAGWCEDRANNGYNSGMGEIFRKVAEIAPIVIQPQIASTDL